MKLLSLFSGAGLGDLGWLMAGFDIVAQCEIDEYCQKVLALRFPESVKYKDIKELTGEKIKKEVGAIDIVAGGFPCQPFSVAGKQRGHQDDRNLWPQMLRVVKEVRPAWIVGENVSGIIPIYLDTILADLETEGYAARTFVFPAHALGANHRRERIWVVGYAGLFGQAKHEKQATGIEQPSENVADSADSGTKGMCQRKESTDKYVAHAKSAKRKQPRRARTGRERFTDRGKTLADTKSKQNRREEQSQFQPDFGTGSKWREYWSAEPAVGRVAHGVAHRVDRLKALGNGQVVACTAFIGQRIMEFERLTLPAAREKG